MAQHLTLTHLQRIRQWHVAHRADHPLEYQLWDAILMFWVLGWMGWLPAIALDDMWALPLCPLGIACPALYVRWRQRAHAAQRLRCDWVGLAPEEAPHH